MTPYSALCQDFKRAVLRKQGALVFTVWNIEDVVKGLGL